jgi:nucleotide-binding universal stress UspA family protein
LRGVGQGKEEEEEEEEEEEVMTAKEIIVGVDDSPSARAAIRWAAAYARSTGAVLRAIHVVAWPATHEMYAYPVVADHIYPDASQLEDGERLPSMRVFEEVHPEPNWTLQFAQGDTGHIMVGESKKADLLVLGAREHRGYREDSCWLGRSLLPKSCRLPSNLSACNRTGPRSGHRRHHQHRNDNVIFRTSAVGGLTASQLGAMSSPQHEKVHWITYYD